jgi:hypothetical protein
MSQHPSVWPPKYFEVNVGCPECGLVSLYTEPCLLWIPSQTQDHDQAQENPYSNAAWWLVEFDCAEQNCGIHVEFLAVTHGGETIGDLLEKLSRGDYVGKCKKGHAYSNAGIDSCSINQFFEFPGS